MSTTGVMEMAAAVPADLKRRLDALRARVTRGDHGPGMDHMMAAICEAVERLSIEHAGMAQELLGVYEQLGAVFDVTRRLPTVQSESEVVDLFVDSLRQGFSRRDVFTVPPAAEDSPGGGGVVEGLADWLQRQVRGARARGSVVVAQAPTGIGDRVFAEAMIGPVFSGDTFVCAIVLTAAEGVEPFRASDMLLLESLTLFCGDLIRNLRLMGELRQLSIAMVRSLVNAVDQKDEYTSGHSLRVGYYATLLGKALGMGEVELQMLQWSALLHDVGKIGIRDAVLKKEGKLTEEEFAHIKEHPVRSHKVVQEIPQLAAALDGVLYHHERYNGSGYPAGLRGEAIPLQARIIQIADVFDALTSNRAYRPAYGWEKALEIMEKESGQTVDPHLRSVFDGVIRSLVAKSDDGWKSIIREANGFAQRGERYACAERENH